MTTHPEPWPSATRSSARRCLPPAAQRPAAAPSSRPCSSSSCRRSRAHLVSPCHRRKLLARDSRAQPRRLAASELALCSPARATGCAASLTRRRRASSGAARAARRALRGSCATEAAARASTCSLRRGALRPPSRAQAARRATANPPSTRPRARRSSMPALHPATDGAGGGGPASRRRDLITASARALVGTERCAPGWKATPAAQSGWLAALRDQIGRDLAHSPRARHRGPSPRSPTRS